MATTLDVDYLVVGAGAMGMAFTDALVDHADVRVALVDRRHAAGGHWLAAYPFVRLHQASTFYGVASTVLGGQVQVAGPETGLHERAGQPAIVAYYDQVLAGWLGGSDGVSFFPGCEYDGARAFHSRISGERFEVPAHCRVVDARYLAPDIPAEMRPRFEVEDGARVVPVNDVVRLEEAPTQYVVVGSGKTATDAIVWLLIRGVDPDRVCWVRPREPWMLNRALIQPAPEIYLGMVATMMELAAGASSLDTLFLALEEAGIMLRIDPTVTPTMAKAPTLGGWELELLRSVTNVVRLGHLRSVRPGHLELTGGSVDVAADALVVNCAADGLKNPPLLPIWQSSSITLQPVRAGFPCFGAALTGYVEATRREAPDELKNALVAPSAFGNSLAQWAQMNVLGLRNTAAFSSQPDIKDWANRVALNPSRVPPGHRTSPELSTAQERLQSAVAPGLARLDELAH
jgi:NAD(P)-binding Rossmann-like domain